jgi:hypothetical protein
MNAEILVPFVQIPLGVYESILTAFEHLICAASHMVDVAERQDDPTELQSKYYKDSLAYAKYALKAGQFLAHNFLDRAVLFCGSSSVGWSYFLMSWSI